MQKKIFFVRKNKFLMEFPYYMGEFSVKNFILTFLLTDMRFLLSP